MCVVDAVRRDRGVTTVDVAPEAPAVVVADLIGANGQSRHEGHLEAAGLPSRIEAGQIVVVDLVTLHQDVGGFGPVHAELAAVTDVVIKKPMSCPALHAHDWAVSVVEDISDDRPAREAVVVEGPVLRRIGRVAHPEPFDPHVVGAPDDPARARADFDRAIRRIVGQPDLGSAYRELTGGRAATDALERNAVQEHLIGWLAVTIVQTLAAAA